MSGRMSEGQGPETTMEDSITEAMLASMYNKCFKVLSKKNELMPPLDQSSFINCCMRYIQSYKIIAEACYEDDEFMGLDDDE